MMVSTLSWNCMSEQQMGTRGHRTQPINLVRGGNVFCEFCADTQVEFSLWDPRACRKIVLHNLARNFAGANRSGMSLYSKHLKSKLMKPRQVASNSTADV
jgi:hypothetical protein